MWQISDFSDFSDLTFPRKTILPTAFPWKDECLGIPERIDYIFCPNKTSFFSMILLLLLFLFVCCCSFFFLLLDDVNLIALLYNYFTDSKANNFLTLPWCHRLHSQDLQHIWKQGAFSRNNPTPFPRYPWLCHLLWILRNPTRFTITKNVTC